MVNILSKKIIPFILSSILIVSLSFPAFATDIIPPASVFDNADIVSDEEESALETRIGDIEKAHKIDVVIATTDDLEDKTAQEYANDFYDNNGFKDDGILYLLDVKDRTYAISTKGMAIRLFPDYSLDDMTSNLTVYLPDEPYSSMNSYLTSVEYYAEQGISDSQYNIDTETGEVSEYNHINTSTIFIYIGIALVIALICCGGVFAKYKLIFSQYKYPLKERSKIDLTEKSDIFLRENITTRHIESSSGGSGGGSASSTHSSSSRSSHGGKSGSF